jgi:hypothetical protein
VLQIISTTSNNLFIQIDRLRSGAGDKGSLDPRTAEPLDDARQTTELRGPPSPKGNSAAAKNRIAGFATSSTPARGGPDTPTICTAGNRGFPVLPPPERPAEDEKSPDSLVDAVDLRWITEKTPLYCSGGSLCIQRMHTSFFIKLFIRSLQRAYKDQLEAIIVASNRYTYKTNEGVAYEKDQYLTLHQRISSKNRMFSQAVHWQVRSTIN